MPSTTPEAVRGADDVPCCCGATLRSRSGLWLDSAGCCRRGPTCAGARQALAGLRRGVSQRLAPALGFVAFATLGACFEPPENPVPWGTGESDPDERELGSTIVDDGDESDDPDAESTGESGSTSTDDDDSSGGGRASGTPDAAPMVQQEPELEPPPEGCEDYASRPPRTLSCTGLYADIAQKSLSDGVELFAPASALWSDGAEKKRFIKLPEHGRIDTSDMGEWRFPLGTKVWKEFKVNGKRVETRIFYKVRQDRWLRAAYEWNDDESEAAFTFGGDIQFDGEIYHIPEQGECDECHEGQADRLLGFGAVSLGLEGASGITLADLVEAGLLTDPPSSTRLSVGDDGTGLAAEVLPMLHINCGISCHNDGPNATAGGTDLELRLEPEWLDGSAPNSEWAHLATAVNVPPKGTDFRGYLRIDAGRPSSSLIVRLMETRRENGKDQMPPIASRKVDQSGLSLVERWISRL